LYSFPKASASILVERFLDFAILLLVPIAATLALLSQSFFIVQSQILGSLLVLVAFIAFFLAIRSDRFLEFAVKILARTFKHSETLKDRAPQFAEELALGMRKMLTPKRALPALGMTLIIWLLEVSKLLFLAQAVGIPALPLEVALIAGSLSYVAGHALIIPSGFGIFLSQSALLVLLFPTWISLEQAISIALLDIIVYVVALTITGAPSIATQRKEKQEGK
jgi:hypothetical protein